MHIEDNRNRFQPGDIIFCPPDPYSMKMVIQYHLCPSYNGDLWEIQTIIGPRHTGYAIGHMHRLVFLHNDFSQGI